MILTWGQQARPVGLSTLEQVQALRDQAIAGAQSVTAQAITAFNIIHDDAQGIPAERFAGLDFSGESDSRAAFSAAVASAQGGKIILPKNSALNLISSEPIAIPPDGIIIESQQGNSHLVHYEESLDLNPNGWADMFSGVGAGDLVLRGVNLRGMHRTNRTQGACRFVSAVQGGHITIERCVLQDARALMVVLRGVNGLRARYNTLLRGRRDGFHVIDPRDYVEIMNNRFLWMRDDPVHVNFTAEANTGLPYPPGGEQFRIDENVLMGSLGLLVSGGRRGSISRNIGRFGTNRFIKLGVAGAIGGDATPVDIIISENICEDQLPAIDAGSAHCMIELRFATASSGALDAIPGIPASDGTVDLPSDFFAEKGQRSDPLVPAVHATGIRVRGNVYRKTSSAKNFIDYGLGPYIRRDSDDSSLAVTDAMLRPVAMLISGSARDLFIEQNDFDGVASGIDWDMAEQPRLAALDVVIRWNKFKDWDQNAIAFRNGSKSTAQRVTIAYNDFDGDPFFRHAARASNGRWLQQTGVAALDLRGLAGTEVVGNHYRNVSAVFAIQPANGSSDEVIRDNIAYCDPVGDDYHADNKGIGRLPSPWGFRYVIEDSDPTSPTWGKLLNPCRDESLVVPTGKWVKGAFVRSLNPESGTYGWHRVTTGSGNVVGTDWIAVTGPKAATLTNVSADAFVNITTRTPEATIITDTATLTANRTRVLLSPGSGTATAKYLNLTTGDFTVGIKSLANANADLVRLAAGEYAEFVWDGTGWRLLFKAAA